MRRFLLLFGWASLIGSTADGLIAMWLLMLMGFAGADALMTVDQHLREHLPFLYWVRALAEMLFPPGFVAWIFGLPALVYFPVLAGVSVLLGGWALSAAKPNENRQRLKSQKVLHRRH